MRKRLTAVLLVLCMVFSLLPASALATGDVAGTEGAASAGSVVVSKKTYAVAPDITEYELTTNNSGLTAQQAGHVMEVNLGSSAEIITGYNDYNIAAIQSGRNWGMRRATEQAQSAETVRDVNVVGAVNGDFFNMSNGAPSGVLVMNETVIKSSGGTSYFYIDKDNTAHIARGGTALPEGVKEAVGGGVVLMENGKIASGLSSTYDTTQNPRTAIGIKADGTVVIYMVDGRQSPYSVGMTTLELAEMMMELDCEEAINLDGGGSSTFATQREGEKNNNTTAGLTIRNRPSDGYERTVSSSLLVVSKAAQTGVFDHAVLSPYEEVYTPGSAIQFTATGVDAAGGPAELPASGLAWSVTNGADLGSIDPETGVFTANADAIGSVTVSLSYDGVTVGTTSVELQWPDKLGFTNTSVSLDFGESSDLTFNPTYQGREVHYKDGDFAWSLSPTYYKFDALVDPKTNNTKGDFSMAITPEALNKDTVVVEYYAWGSSLTYTSTYKVTELIQSSTDDGMEKITATVSYVSSGGAIGEKRPAEDPQKFEGTIGSFSDNRFIADEDSSLRGTITASCNDLTGSIDVVVGMEPFVLMDFEDHVNADGTVTPAEDYWTCHVGSAANGSNGELSVAEVKANRLWIRDTTKKGVKFPEGYNTIVNAEDDSDVRFGEHAFRLGYDFTGPKEEESIVKSADFGFSGDLLVNTVQPTRIGMWINVPKDCADDNSLLKAVLKGAAVEADLATAYMTLQEDGSMTYTEGKQLTGTAAYVQYYSYDAAGNVTGSKLSDWAGKGWTWVEADISAYQMPVDVCRAYTVRVTSPQNCTKSSGYLYIDNLQFIYGTNTNDINNPIIENASEKASGTVLSEDAPVEFNSGTLNFEAVYGDSEQTDKYATGIDVSGVRVYVDGIDQTAAAEVNAGTLYLTASGLKNGGHTLKLTVKDAYGNVTTKTYPFTVNDDAGEYAQLSVVGQEAPPKVGSTYTLNVVNSDIPVDLATVVIEVPNSTYASEDAYTVQSGAGYEVESALDVQSQQITLTIRKLDDAENYDSTVASVTFRIPETAREGSTFKFSVPMGSYETASGTASFSQTETTVALTADYAVSVSQAIEGFPAAITVTDSAGNPVPNANVYVGETLLGTTEEDGKLSYTFTKGAKVLHAQTETGRSWNSTVVVHEISDEGPFAAQSNASADGSTTRSVTWLSPIGDAPEAQSLVRLSEQAEALADAEPIVGSNSFVTFTMTTSGTALRLNSVALSGLTPETTYYYQVGDGEWWSEVYSFTTASADPTAETNFFVFGDIQTSDTSRLASAIDKVAGSELAYAFGIQTGDAIDDVTKFENWRSYCTVLNSATLQGIDMVHTMGNHEYYGDADGSVAGGLFSLPESAQGSFYSAEYGSVYVGVINNGGDLLAALEEMKADAVQSNCIWKVLAIHEPIYGTTGEMNAETRKQATALIEAAGIDFVFSGDDHSYARTYPMLGDAVTEDSQNGVVYYISGDLSNKDNEYHTHDYYAKSMPHSEYQGMYLSVQANSTGITVTAYDYNGNLLDSYTKERTACEQGNHTYDESSRYDFENKTISCALCGETAPVEEVGYTGILTLTDGENRVMLNNGVVQVGWFAVGEDICHTSDNGILHDTVTTDTATCLENGRLTAHCNTCGENYLGAGTWSKGHTWDENHMCTVCGTEGIDIANADLKIAYKYYSYTGKAINPASTATYDGKRLDARSDRYGTDAYISYNNNTNIGVATVTYSGRGNYYGETSATFTIVPASVSKLSVAEIGKDSVALTWSAAKGAQEYMIQQKINGAWKQIAVTSGTSYTVTGLESEQAYSFRVHTRAQVDGKTYYCISYSDELRVNTIADPATLSATYVTDVSCALSSAETLNVQQVDGDRYLFLPASVDLNALALQFTVRGSDKRITLTGNQGALQLESYTQTVDLASIASVEADGSYKISVCIGDLKPFVVNVMKSANIRTMYLTSDDADAAGRTYVEQSKENAATGQMLLTAADGSAIYDGALSQIKCRGNSTFTYYDKKSYQIKLDSKTDLLGTGEKVKTWVLLAGYGDATQMHDKLFKDLAAELGMDYVASCDWVDLYYDGEYRGTYLLSEKNSVNSTSVDITDMEALYERVNPDYGTNEQTAEGTNRYGQVYQYTKDLAEPENITGGYLLELNHDFIDEASGFYTAKDVAFNVKSPEWAGETAMQYISEYYQAFENAVYATDEAGNYTGYNPETELYYYDYCDMESLVQMYLIQWLSANSDAFVSSLFFYKDAGGKLYAGPVWDMELSCGNGWDENLTPTREFLSLRYLSEALIQIPSFKAAVAAYLEDTLAPAVEDLLGADGKIADYGATLSASAAMNYVLWPYVRVGLPDHENHLWAEGTSYADVTGDLEQWLTQRLEHMKTRCPVARYAITAPDSVSHGAITVSADQAREDTVVTITVTPDSGYLLENLRVVTQDGTAVDVTETASGQYTFVMPAAPVAVEADFAPKSVPPTTHPFVDVPDGTWYADAVAYVYGKGIMIGVGEGRFDPNGVLTRAMVVTILWRQAGEPAATKPCTFTDLTQEWYKAAVAWAAETGVVTGRDAATFDPAGAITRQEMATMLYRYAQYRDYDVSQTADLSGFPDNSTVYEYAQTAMAWANANGLIQGNPVDGINYLDPLGNATRAQAATILMRFCENIAK